MRFGARHVSGWFGQPPIVEPVDPFECGELDGFEGAPRITPMDHLGLEQAVDRLGERVLGWTLPAPFPGWVNRETEELCRCLRSIWRSSRFAFWASMPNQAFVGEDERISCAAIRDRSVAPSRKHDHCQDVASEPIGI